MSFEVRNFSSVSSRNPRQLGSVWRSAPLYAASVHGGGFGNRISVSRGFGAGALGASGGVGASRILSNEKETMQDLNERLSAYLEKVRQLEAANNHLEIEIKKILEVKGSCDRNWNEQEDILSKLRQQVFEMIVENANLDLQIDNAQLAANDFKIKWDAELSIRQSVEMDINALRKQIDDNNIGRLHLESEIESLKEELIYIRKNHDEEVRALQAQIGSSSVQVEVDAVKGVDLSKMLADIRAEYEGLAQKNKDDAENWYKKKMESHTIEMTQNEKAVDGFKIQITELRRQAQGLEIELESLRSMKNSLENNLEDTELRYQIELDKLNGQYAMYQLEMDKVNQEMQLRHFKPVTQTIVKTIEITQQLVDGKVVSENESVIQG
uniref:Keratin 18a, tandem duplicate 1 n=1 Tax=Callorhinchus milii TaxID=7868 RepID=A0A4W3H4H5_CALMI